MANCNKLFEDFLIEIKISKDKTEYLKNSRKAVRDKIRKYFEEELKKKAPKFAQQGSYALKTMVNPIDGEYDIDDGVYLEHLDADMTDWPKTETVHNYIVQAIDGHTSSPPIDKAKCVRLVYQNDYHIDFPIYAYSEENDKYFLAIKGDDQWSHSDQQDFKDWFIEKLNHNGEQLRRLIMYLKAWKDYKAIKFPGVAITIIVGNLFVKSENRDDIALKNVVQSILSHLQIYRKIEKPVEPYDNVLEGLTENQLDSLIEGLSKLLDIANEAIYLSENEKEKASKLWIKQFGDRFPECEDDSKQNDSMTAAPHIQIEEAPAKPWQRN